jgi:hypothetical protein
MASNNGISTNIQAYYHYRLRHTLDVDDVETTVVALTVSDDTNTTHVTTTGSHDDSTGIELDKVNDLASGELDLDSVVDLDGRVGVTDAIERKLANPCSDI